MKFLFIMGIWHRVMLKDTVQDTKEMNVDILDGKICGRRRGRLYALCARNPYGIHDTARHLYLGSK
jgi:hypothetical protein